MLKALEITLPCNGPRGSISRRLTVFDSCCYFFRRYDNVVDRVVSCSHVVKPGCGIDASKDREVSLCYWKELTQAQKLIRCIVDGCWSETNATYASQQRRLPL